MTMENDVNIEEKISRWYMVREKSMMLSLVTQSHCLSNTTSDLSAVLCVTTPSVRMGCLFLVINTLLICG